MSKVTITMSNKAYTAIKFGMLALLLVVAATFLLTNITFSPALVSAVQVEYIINSTAAATANNTYTNFTLTWPENSSTSLWVTNVSINLTTNTSFTDCKFSIDLDDTWSNMINLSVNNQSWWNASAINYINFPTLRNGDWHNISFHCYNASLENSTWTNSSLMRFRIHSVAPQGFGISITSPLNGTVYTNPGVRVVVNDTPINCSLKHTNDTFELLANITTDYRVWSNATAIPWGSDTVYGSWNNLSIWCYDEAGNLTTSNLTASTGSHTLFKIDTTAPVLNGVSWSLANRTSPTGTTYGNMMTATFNVSDTSSNVSVFIRMCYQSANITTAGSETESNRTGYMNTTNNHVNITLDDVEEDGEVVFEVCARDDALLLGCADANYTAQIWRLKTGWNYFQDLNNNTLPTLANWIHNITYTALFKNDYKNKTWATHTTGGTAASTIVTNTTNATAIYITQDALLIRESYPSATSHLQGYENVTLWHNATNTSGWNVVGMLKRTTLNKTMWHEDIANISGFGGTDAENITWASYWDAQLGKFCSGHRDRRKLSCSNTWYMDNYIIPKGGVVQLYVAHQVNFSYNRTEIDSPA